MPFTLKNLDHLARVCNQFGLGWNRPHTPAVPFVDPRRALASGPLIHGSFVQQSFTRLIDGVWRFLDDAEVPRSDPLIASSYRSLPTQRRGSSCSVAHTVSAGNRHLLVKAEGGPGRFLAEVARAATEEEQQVVTVNPEARGQLTKLGGQDILQDRWPALPEGGKWLVRVSHEKEGGPSFSQQLVLNCDGSEQLTVELKIPMRHLYWLVQDGPLPRHFSWSHDSTFDEVEGPDIEELGPEFALWLAAFLREGLVQKTFPGPRFCYPPLQLLVEEDEDPLVVNLAGSTLVYPTEVSPEDSFQLFPTPEIRIDHLPEEGEDTVDDLWVSFQGTLADRALPIVATLANVVYAASP